MRLITSPGRPTGVLAHPVGGLLAKRRLLPGRESGSGPARYTSTDGRMDGKAADKAFSGPVVRHD